jgi:hypothetical protein
MGIRNYEPSDFEEIKRIHAESGLPYNLPALNVTTDSGTKRHPLWLVTKVLEIEGKVRAAFGAWIQVELFAWLDKSDWTDPEGKLLALHALEIEVMKDVYLNGVEHAVLFLPPGLERFGERLSEDYGFTEIGNGWKTYAKAAGA